MPLAITNLKEHPDYKKEPKQVFTLADTHLSSTLGHSAFVPAKKPTYITWQLFEVAARSGCVDYSPATADAMLEAIAAVENPTSADEEAVVDSKRLITDAVRKVMLVGDASTFTDAGVPKLVAVKAFLDQGKAEAGISVDIPLDREIVYDVFLGLQDVKPVEPQSDPMPTGELEGEDSGGSVADMLDRVGPTEE